MYTEIVISCPFSFDICACHCLWYGDGVGNTTEVKSVVFTLM